MSRNAMGLCPRRVAVRLEMSDLSAFMFMLLTGDRKGLDVNLVSALFYLPFMFILKLVAENKVSICDMLLAR